MRIIALASTAPGPSAQQQAIDVQGGDGDVDVDVEAIGSGDVASKDDIGSMVDSDQSGDKVAHSRGFLLGSSNNGDVIELEGHCFLQGEEDAEDDAKHA